MFSVFADFKLLPDFDKFVEGAALTGASIVHGNILDALNSHGETEEQDGQTPEVDPVHLTGSFYVFTSSVIEAEVGSNIDDPGILENSANRPLIAGAIEKSKPEVAEAVEKTIEEKWR